VKDYPLAEARLVTTRRGRLWVVERCPLCARAHTHGAGRLHDDPGRFLGHRIAHCVTDDPAGGYVLVELEERTA